MIKNIIWVIKKIVIGIILLIIANSICNNAIPYTPITIAVASFFSIPGILFILCLIYIL